SGCRRVARGVEPDHLLRLRPVLLEALDKTLPRRLRLPGGPGDELDRPLGGDCAEFRGRMYLPALAPEHELEATFVVVPLPMMWRMRAHKADACRRTGAQPQSTAAAAEADSVRSFERDLDLCRATVARVQDHFARSRAD